MPSLYFKSPNQATEITEDTEKEAVSPRFADENEK